MLHANLMSLKQQMISVQVRLLVLKESDVEEEQLALEQLAALQREMEQQLFLFHIASQKDEAPQFRNWTEKQDTTNGPLYARTFKRRQDESNWKPNLLHPPCFQQQLSPLPLPPNIPSSNRIMFPCNPPGIDYRFPGENALRHFSMPSFPTIPPSPPPIIPPNFINFRLPMPPAQPPLPPIRFQSPFSYPSCPRDGNA
uniref:WW domain-containing protein n=1 Tax=Elaeophora elaphi TaxID=1147741 RepID=A0A0R3S3V4_9BILA